MNQTLETRAKQIISKILNITVATSSFEGLPWNTPVYSAYDDEYNFYWDSDINAVHSKNIKNNSNVFVVVYDSSGGAEGVYMKGTARMLNEQKEIIHAQNVMRDRLKTQREKDFLEEFFKNTNNAFFEFTPDTMWINDTSKTGIDGRIEISLIGS